MTDERTTVGRDLALRVAELLKSGACLADFHPGYCGIGLLNVEGAFVHVQVGDWSHPTLKEALEMEAKKESECQVFLEQSKFVDWLATQSDHSLSGSHLPDPWLRGNQRLTLARLKAFVGER
jgi:hypothetical protein